MTPAIALAALFAAGTGSTALQPQPPAPPQPPPPGGAVRIVHLPPSEAPAGLPLLLTAKVENGHLLSSLTLHWRQRDGSWNTTAFGKDAQGGYAALIEGKQVTGPSLEYYLTSREEGRPEQARFASEERPHPVLVRGDPEEQERLARLAWHHGHTSSAQLTAEYVGFGSVNGRNDRYYQVEASYQYRLLGAIEHIQLGIGTLRGEVPPPGAFATIGSQDPGRNTGLDYGYGELAFNLSGQTGFTGRVFLGADELGFVTGAAGMLRIGRETFAHVELGGQFVQRVGYDVSLRLAWDTVPRWPIGFAVHITNAPNAPVQAGATPDNPLTDKGAPAGIRALLDAGYQLSSNVTLLFKGGYQARFSTAGGVTLGAGAQVEW